MKFRKINVHPLRGADPRLRAVANILTADGYAINGIRVYEDKGKMYVRFPIVHTQRLSTLLHEMAHGMLQHGMDTGKSRAQREFEADALSVMLESAMGLPITDTRKEHMSVEYKNYITELKTGKTDEEKAEINEQIDKVFKPIGDLYKRHAPQILAALRLSGIQPQPIKTAQQAAPAQEEKTPEHVIDKPKRKMNRSL